MTKCHFRKTLLFHCFKHLTGGGGARAGTVIKTMLYIQQTLFYFILKTQEYLSQAPCLGRSLEWAVASRIWLAVILSSPRSWNLHAPSSFAWPDAKVSGGMLWGFWGWKTKHSKATWWKENRSLNDCEGGTLLQLPKDPHWIMAWARNKCCWDLGLFVIVVSTSWLI